VIRFLSDEERAALLEAAEAKSPDLHAIIVLALSTGARRNEILGLRWPEVDLKSGLLTFAKTKNGSVRRVPITGKALDLLKDIAAARKLKDPSGLVFPGRTQATADKPLAIENVFQAALKDAAIENFRFHDLRHSAASYLVRAGVDMRTVAEILGHRDLKMTQRYAHLSRAHVTDAMGKLDSVMFGCGQ
jgi:integrase